jgi:RNA polymerase sigma-70 factor (ECF subfamily)
MEPMTTGTVLRQVRRVLHVASNVSDGQLLERFVRDGDEAAFEVLVWRHQRMVFAVCRQVLHRHHDAEDAFQATFLVLARKAGSIQKQTCIAGWLHRVACRVALRLRAGVRETSTGGTTPDHCGRDVPPTEQVERDELGALLHEEIHRLPAKYRVPIVLCYLQGKSCTEAAALLGSPRGTVATRLAQGRALLRSRLSSRGAVIAPTALAGFLFGQQAQAAAASVLLSTARAAAAVAAGRVPGHVSARVLQLAETVGKTMWLMKSKCLACGLTALAVVVTGGILALWQLSAADEPVAPQKSQEARSKKQTAKTDKEKLQGTWVGESIEGGEANRPIPGLASLYRITFTGDAFTLRFGKEEKGGTFRIDAGQKPKHLDIEITGETAGMIGIYKLKGDVLVLCGTDSNKERPTEFKATKGAVILTFRRQGKGTPKQDEATTKKIMELAEKLLEARVQNERLRAEMAELQAKFEQQRLRQQVRERYISCTLKEINIEKNYISVQLGQTTLEVKNIPIATDAKYKLNGKECTINDFKAGMAALVQVDTRDGRSAVVEIKGTDKKKQQ